MPELADSSSVNTDDLWPNTAPMAWAEDHASARDFDPCPWGQEMLGAPAIIELHNGQVMRCELLTWDAARRQCCYVAPSWAETVLPLGRMRSVSLTRRHRHRDSASFDGLGGPSFSKAPVPFKLMFTDGTLLQGVTLGRVERPEGHYLFRRVDDTDNTLRLFVPHSAIDHVHFDEARGHGAPRVDQAAPVASFQPVRDQARLQQAVAMQADGRVMRLGEVLMGLGLVTPEQLDNALALREGEAAAMPLGERLVRGRVLSLENLQRALHMKMGYPVIDLRSFPIDKALLRRMPCALARELKVLPVGVVDRRVVVAMENPGRIKVLEQLKFLFDATVIPALPWRDTVEKMVPEVYCAYRLGGHGRPLS